MKLLDKRIPKYWLIIIVLGSVLSGLVFAQTILATSNTIKITVSPPLYFLTLYVNGTLTGPSVISSGDVLNLTAVTTPQQAQGRTITFYENNTALGAGTVASTNGLLEVQGYWTVPAMTTPNLPDYYALNATLT